MTIIHTPPQQARFDDLPGWKQHICTTISILVRQINADNDPYGLRFSSRTIWALRPLLPYVIHAVSDSSDYILLNRDYKPVGTITDQWVDYGKYPHHRLTHGEMTCMVPALFRHQIDSPVIGVLFQDHCGPWQSRTHAMAYLKRLRACVEVQSAQQVVPGADKDAR